MLKRLLVRIQWRTLVYCGIGLWIALCVNDFYYGEYNEYNELLLSTDKESPTTVNTHQVVFETDAALMTVSNFIEKGHESWGTLRKSRILTTFIVIFVSIWSILLIVCIQEYTKKNLEKFINVEYFKQEPNSNKKTCKSTGIQVLYTSHSLSTTLHYEKDKKRPNYEWFSTLKSSTNTASYIFEEGKNEHRIIYKSLEPHEKETCNINNKEYNKCKIERLYNESFTYQCKPVFQLIHYIYLCRSIHFQSILLSQKYTFSIFNTFNSLSVIYLFNSLPLRYSLKKYDFFDSNNRKEIIVNKLKILNWSSKKNKEIQNSKNFGQTNGYIISSSPAFQQFVETFMNVKYTKPTCL